MKKKMQTPRLDDLIFWEMAIDKRTEFNLVWDMWLQVCVCAWMCACSCARRTARFLLRVLLVLCFFVGRLQQEEMSEACGKTKPCSPLGQENIFREWKSTDCFLLMALIEIEPLFVSTFNSGSNHFNSPWTGHLHTRAWQFWVFKDLKIGSAKGSTHLSICPSIHESRNANMGCILNAGVRHFDKRPHKDSLMKFAWNHSPVMPGGETEVKPTASSSSSSTAGVRAPAPNAPSTTTKQTHASCLPC